MSAPFPHSMSGLFLLRAVVVLLMLLASATAIVQIETEQWRQWSARTLVIAGMAVLFVLCHAASLLATSQSREARARLLLWVKALLLGGLLLSVNHSEVIHYFAGFWVARTPYVYRLRTCLYLTAGVLVLTIGTTLLRGLEWPLWLILLLVPTYLFILAVSGTAVSERRLRNEAEMLNQQLQQAQLKLAEAARHSERLRIARDMHDVLGHQLTALVLNLEIAIHKAQEPALGHVEQALALARMALGDLRNAVGDLRDNPEQVARAAPDFRTALDLMLAQIPGLEIRLDCDDSLLVDDPVTAETLLRCIQEAVTNTLRHANAQRCSISLRQQEGQLLLEVRDDGHCPPHIEPGNGLHGMRERLHQLAGKLHWQIHQGSLLLQANLPLPLPLPLQVPENGEGTR